MNMDSIQKKLIISALSVLLVLVLAVSAALAWFAIDEGGTKPLSLTVGKVAYSVGTEETLFYKAFELENDYVEDDFSEEDGYLPAVSIVSVLAGGEEAGNTDGVYSYSLRKNTRIRFTVAFNPSNATDKISYSSSDSSVVSISRYGTVSAVGEPGNSAVITITASDRDPSPERRSENLTATVTVTVTENPGSDNQYGYLPGNVNILRNPLALINTSTVATKARIKIEWEYSDFSDDEAAENEYKKYSVAELFSQAAPGVSVKGTIIAPLSLTLDSAWRPVPSDGFFTVSDVNGMAWTVETLSLRDSDHAALINAIQNGTTFVISEKMIDRAYIYICYSTQDIASANTDYGASLPANAHESGTLYTAVSAMTTSDFYASFSTRKRFTVSLAVQARQAKAYDEPKWYDVYCLKENLGGEDHAQSGG